MSALCVRPGSWRTTVPYGRFVLGRNWIGRLAGLFWLGAVLQLHALTSLLLWPTVLAGFLAAVYTAFLFGQCEGRDLWQTPLLPVHLIVQALMCGAAVLALLPTFVGGSEDNLGVARLALVVTLAMHLLIVAAEFLTPHTTDNSAYAARLITHGPFRRCFWGGTILAGGIVPRDIRARRRF